jgi:hypothetical protein
MRVARAGAGLGWPWEEIAAELGYASRLFLDRLIARDRGEVPTVRRPSVINSPEDLLAVIRGADASEPMPDYSELCSWRTYDYLLAALAAGEMHTARGLAERMWDPEDAPYIGPRSSVCTPNQRQLALAVRASVLENDKEALRELSALKNPVRPIRAQADMVRAIAFREALDFADARREYRAWSDTQRANVHDKSEVLRQMLPLPALGLTTLAQSRGLSVAALPPAS